MQFTKLSYRVYFKVFNHSRFFVRFSSLIHMQSDMLSISGSLAPLHNISEK